MSDPSAGLWDGLNDAKVFENGVYFDSKDFGTYDVEIVRAINFKSQKSGFLFTVECEVLNSTNPADPVGAKRTWQQSMKNTNVAFGAVKGFLAAIYNVSPNAPARRTDFDPYLQKFILRVTGAENILRGTWVHLETHYHKTEEGKDFTRHDWSPFDYLGCGVDVTAPDWPTVRDSRPTDGAAPTLFPSNAPAVWTLPPGGQLSPDARQYWAPGMAAWAPVPAAPAPPPMAPPMPPPLPVRWTLPPGGQLSPDARQYWAPGMAAWAPVPV